MNSKMLFYILKRVLLALLTIWIVITVTFFVMHSIPGGPFASEKAISAEAQAALEAKYGLDKPLGEQYVTYLRDVVTKLDFGPSLKQRGRQVIDIILDGMKTSAKLGLIAAFSAAIAGIVLGALAALRRNTVLDKIIMVITTAFVSMPSFIMGSFLLIVFSVKLGWVPANGATAEGLILPIITLALYPMSYITRLTRSSMLDVLGQDYFHRNLWLMFIYSTNKIFSFAHFPKIIIISIVGFPYIEIFRTILYILLIQSKNLSFHRALMFISCCLHKTPECQFHKRY